MNNYILKNLVLFIGVVIISIALVGVVQMYSMDRNLVSEKRMKLALVNQDFEQHADGMIEDTFSIIQFLINTSYPQVAVDFGMYQQFYDMVAELTGGNEPLGLILYDRAGRALSRNTSEKMFTDDLQLLPPFDGRAHLLYIGVSEVVYIRPFYSAGHIAGYLGGVKSRASIVKSLETTYRERTVDFAMLSPAIRINYGAQGFVYPTLAFSQKQPQTFMYGLTRHNTALIILLTAGILVFSTFVLRKSLRKPFLNIVQLIQLISLNDDRAQALAMPSDPLFRRIATALLDMHQQRRQLELEKRERAVAVNIAQIATQVAHDIRSPLAALEVATAGLAALPEDKRLLVRGATARIRDIANSLIAQSRVPRVAEGERTAPEGAGAREDTAVELLSSLINPLITEKRMQHRGRSGVEITAELGEAAYGLFASVQPTELKRVLSNLVNNAVEGIVGGGTVTVRLRPCDDMLCVEVADTGRGIPADVLPKLMERGATFGKTGGSGLGLFHAREAVERWGGTLEVQSVVGKGTTVTIRLPAAAPAPWFVPFVTLRDGMTVVVLDDDQSIHDIWEGRLAPLRRQLPLLTVLHFATADDLSAWYEARPSPRPSPAGGEGGVLYLCDYELIGQPANGLALIEQLHIAPHAILVTSRYEDAPIRQQCASLGVRLIPKGLAGFVPIRITNADVCEVRGARCEVQSPDLGRRTSDPGLRPTATDNASCAALPCDCVLIDDDPSIHMVWNIVAKDVGKTVLVFAKTEAFLAVAQQIAKTTPIYVDSNLGDGIKGEEVSKTIHDLGFENIYLATGYNAADFGPLPWIKGIIGKDPPW